VFRAVFSDEACQGVDGRKPLVACRDTAVPIALKMCEELANQFRSNIHDLQAIGCHAGL